MVFGDFWMVFGDELIFGSWVVLGIRLWLDVLIVV